MSSFLLYLRKKINIATCFGIFSTPPSVISFYKIKVIWGSDSLGGLPNRMAEPHPSGRGLTSSQEILMLLVWDLFFLVIF
jgi:hypothetical protein